MTSAVPSDLARERRLLASTTIAQLFAQDPDRFARLSFEWDGWLFDFSKERLRSDTLPLLVDHAIGSGLPGWIAALFAGETVNQSERRPALYTALREVGLYQGRTRTWMAAVAPAWAARAWERIAPARPAPLIAAEDESGSAASTMICASAVRPRFTSRWKSGGMTVAALASPRSISAFISSRFQTDRSRSKFPVLSIVCTNRRLSGDCDWSRTTVGRWRTSV